MANSKEAGIISGTAGLISKHPVAALGAGLTGAAVIRGSMDANKHNDQIRQQMEAMKQDASTPVQKFASALNTQIEQFSSRYDKFAEIKLHEKTANPNMPSFGNSMLSSMGGSIVGELAKQLFATPITKAFEIIKRKLYLEPKQQNVLQEVLQGDPMLARAMQETPEVVIGAYTTIKQYAPSLTVDPNTLKNFLRQAVALGGQLDPMTVKLLAETEKTIRQARGQIGGH